MKFSICMVSFMSIGDFQVNRREKFSTFFGKTTVRIFAMAAYCRAKMKHRMGKRRPDSDLASNSTWKWCISSSIGALEPEIDGIFSVWMMGITSSADRHKLYKRGTDRDFSFRGKRLSKVGRLSELR